MTTAMTLEFAPFVTKPGVTESQLLEASQSLQRDFLEKRDGFVSRHLLKEADGNFADIIWWTSADAAERAMKEVFNSPVCVRYFELMQIDATAPNGGVRHFATVAEYVAAE